jgi:hypothetical protein
LSSLLCPSDISLSVPKYNGSGLPPTVVNSNVASYGFAKGNFAAYMSPIHMNHFRARPGALGGYKQGSALGQNLKKITDGLSKTALASEVRTLDRDWDSRGVWAGPWPGGSIVGVNFHDVDTGLSTSNYQPDPQGVINVRLPNSQLIGADQIIACPQPAYSRDRKMPCQVVNSVYGAPRSVHPGGVNLVMMDNAMGFLVDAVDPYVYAFLVSTNDRRAVDTKESVR